MIAVCLCQSRRAATTPRRRSSARRHRRRLKACGRPARPPPARPLTLALVRARAGISLAACAASSRPKARTSAHLRLTINRARSEEAHHAAVERLLRARVPDDLAKLIVRDFGGGMHKCATLVKEAVRDVPSRFLASDIVLMPGMCELGCSSYDDVAPSRLCGYSCIFCRMDFCTECCGYTTQCFGRTVCPCSLREAFPFSVHTPSSTRRTTALLCWMARCQGEGVRIID